MSISSQNYRSPSVVLETFIAHDCCRGEFLNVVSSAPTQRSLEMPKLTETLSDHSWSGDSGREPCMNACNLRPWLELVSLAQLKIHFFEPFHTIFFFIVVFWFLFWSVPIIHPCCLFRAQKHTCEVPHPPHPFAHTHTPVISNDISASITCMH